MLLAATFPSVQLKWSQKYISLITNSLFNNFAFIVQFKHKGYILSWLYFMCFSFTIGHFARCILQENLLFLGRLFRIDLKMSVRTSVHKKFLRFQNSMQRSMSDARQKRQLWRVDRQSRTGLIYPFWLLAQFSKIVFYWVPLLCWNFMLIALTNEWRTRAALSR